MLKGYMGIRVGFMIYYDEVIFFIRDCICIFISGVLVVLVGVMEEMRSWCVGDFVGNGYVGC